MNSQKPPSPDKENDQSKKPASHKEVWVFLRDSGMATFICPKCNRSVAKALDAYKNTEKAVKIKCTCSCGHVYRAILNRRKFPRKVSNFPGQYRFKGERGIEVKIPLRVVDISQKGLRLELNDSRIFTIGEKVTIEFTLDDRDRSQITIEGVVRRTRERSISIEFFSTEHYGRLGGYLLW